ncbi:TIGR00255 family protein [Desulfonauticus submarinus]|uniref:TIGR00255 family protein n=1 Tax=Desulfonauticus submarinus TaxID=206665 RepID=A0A1H0CM72_9BACT|nr:YicC/YloC family endoribonuclease [Desulfonauticus submarinus]SDN58945.1 TIGR00255 family protein [Desulfonauticus submarinus]
MKSMTGYGKYALDKDDYTISWEIKSVNSRFLDIIFKTPYYLLGEQPKWENTIRSIAKRGRIELYLNLTFKNPDFINLKFDQSQALAMLKELESMSKLTALSFKPDLNLFLTLSHLWKNKDQDIPLELKSDLIMSLKEALCIWDKSRTSEGANLSKDIANHLQYIQDLLLNLEDTIKTNVKNKFQELKKRVEQLLQDINITINEDKLLTELAIMADKLDVSEEISRLKSHLSAIEKIKNNQEVGRKLDFYLQECFREINTCGNKAQNSQISQIVVEVKATLEKVREQAQNLE